MMRGKFERQPLSDGPCKRSYSDYSLAYEMKKEIMGQAKIRQETPHGSGKNQAGDATSEEPVEKVAELERRQVDGPR